MENLFYAILWALWKTTYCIAMVLCNLVTAVPQSIGFLVGTILFVHDYRGKSEDKDLLAWAFGAYIAYWGYKIAYYGGGFIIWYLADIVMFKKPGTFAKEWTELVIGIADDCVK